MTGETPSRDDIIRLERAYWHAMKSKDGAKTSELSADAALTTGMNGVTRIPKAKMGEMTEEGKWTLASYAFDSIEVSSPAPNVAIIAYIVKQDVTLNGKPQSFRAADSSTWVRGPTGWECHAHSETILKDPP